MTSTLDEFFRTMEPFLAGSLSAEEVEDRLGKSSSGTVRLALYPVLVRRQKRALLDHFFRSVACACDTETWERLASTFLEAHAPDHWEPNHFAGRFVAHVEAAAGSGSGLPEYLVELADNAWIRHSAMIAPAATDACAGIGSRVFVRQYANGIPEYATAAETGGVEAGARPAHTPCTIAICRAHGRLTTTHLSLAALVALGRRDAHDPARRLPDGLCEEDITREDDALVAMGVLPPRQM